MDLFTGGGLTGVRDADRDSLADFIQGQGVERWAGGELEETRGIRVQEHGGSHFSGWAPAGGSSPRTGCNFRVLSDLT